MQLKKITLVVINFLPDRSVVKSSASTSQYRARQQDAHTRPTDRFSHAWQIVPVSKLLFILGTSSHSAAVSDTHFIQCLLAQPNMASGLFPRNSAPRMRKLYSISYH